MDASEIQPLVSGTVAGAGSFRCQRCGYTISLASSDELPACPHCGGASFARASLFTAGRALGGEVAFTPEPHDERVAWLARAKGKLQAPGQHLAYEQDGELIVMPLTKEWTRVGRSLAADVRLDDPTVSRRHALLVRHPDGVRVLDDRSLNGVFVNGERVDWRTIEDGDEIVVGRYRISFLSVTADELAAADGSSVRLPD